MSSSQLDTEKLDRQWYIVGRRQEYEGEARANLFRVIAVAGFYAVQLVNFSFLSSHTAANLAFQRTITLVCAAWLFIALAVLVAQLRKFFPPLLKHFSVCADLLLVTATCSAGSGPASPLVFVFFLIIAMAALRFSLSLIWTTTTGAIACYLFLLGQADSSWFDDVHVIPVVNQMVIMLCMALTGIVLGQMIRRVRWMANQFAENRSITNP